MFSPVVFPANSELWTSFDQQNEMIVTNPGRALFPRVSFRITNLDKNRLYKMEVSLQRVGHKKYTFEDEKWMENGLGEPELPLQLVEHNDGIRSGSYWMEEGVAFGSLKITNKENKKGPRTILVQSMHKYVPMLHVSCLGQPGSHRASFPIMEFIVVTVYQNELVKDLKVKNNKFAYGKRPLQSDSEKENLTPSPPFKKTPSGSPSSIGTLSPSENNYSGYNQWTAHNQFQLPTEQWYEGMWTPFNQFNYTHFQ